MIYIIDIDQTICNTPEVNGKREYQNAVPYKDRIDKINKLYDEGHTIIYWTARGSSSGLNWFNYTWWQLMKWNCQYHELRMGKPDYTVWIDDKAINADDFFSDQATSLR